MFKLQTQSRSRESRLPLIGILCVLLIAFSATVQIAHSHDLKGTPHADCSLCAVAHAGAAPAILVALPEIVEETIELEIVHPAAPCDCFVFSFYSRPPPAESASV